MEIIILLIVMIIVGLVIAALAGLIWKGERPYGSRGDYLAAILTAIAVGLIDWYVIPAMGFSAIWRFLGVALEPAILALIVLWLMRRARA
jgi:uncharacterized membrane protein YeaQ/YmgE (transglycosylase-associated protein family)